jgi:hypothetical protein
MSMAHVELGTPLQELLSWPTVLAVGPNVINALPDVGVVEVLDFRHGQPVVRVPGWPAPLTLGYAPSMVVAIVVADGRSPDTRRLLEWLDKSGAARRPPVVVWQPGAEATAVAQIVAELRQVITRGASQQMETAQQVARLRATNGELRYRFALAESTLNRRGLSPLHLAFSNEPVIEHSQYDVLNECPAGLTQVLPSGSGGVAAFALHLGPGADAISPRLELALRTLEDNRAIDRWIIEGKDQRPGWNAFALSRTLSGQDRTLELRVTRGQGDERLPLLGLGGGQPIDTFQIKDIATGTSALPRSLALQVWRGIPDTTPSGGLEAHQPVRRASVRRGGFVERAISAGALRDVDHANADAVSFDFKPVWAPPGENAATCHPPSHGLTLGRLPSAVPPEAIKASASIAISHERSQDVDFAMVVAETAVRALEILQGGSNLHPGEGFSGWHPLTAGRTRRISAFSDSSPSARSIFIATQMTRPGDNSYAQARFREFTVMVRG